jgi:hypothetical protein
MAQPDKQGKIHGAFDEGVRNVRRGLGQ